MVENYCDASIWAAVHHGDVLLAVAKDFVEEGTKFALLSGEVELGVVRERLGKVQLDEPEALSWLKRTFRHI